MTSKTSLYKHMKNDMHHRIWVPALSCVVFLLGLIAVIMFAQSITLITNDSVNEYITRRAQIRQEFARIFGMQNFLLLTVSIIGATICGFEGFSFLFSRRKTDFYHALPITRKQFFFLRWFNGILFYVIPYLLFLVLCTIIGGVFGLTSAAFYVNMWIGFAYNLITFLAFYHTAIFAVMLTGQFLVGIIGYGALLLYAYLIRMLLPSYVNTFFDSYRYWGENFLPKLDYLSPATSCYKLYNEQTPANWILFTALAIILFAVSYILYQLRPSEAAENSIAFKAARPIIRILLVIPITLYVALFFNMTAPTAEYIWALFSILLFGSLLHGLIEIIFDFDIRSAFHHKKQLTACLILCAAFFGLFAINPLDYDNRLPTPDSVRAVYVDLPLDNDTWYESEEYLLDNISSNTYYYPDLGITEYRLNQVALTGENISLIYDLIRDCQNTAWTEDITTGSYNLNVKFVKNTGLTETRYFTLYLPENLETLAAVYNCQELRSTHFQVAALPFDLYNGITFTDAAMNSIERSLTKEEIAEFLSIYTKELTTATMDDQINHPPVGSFHLLYGVNSIRLATNYIYGSFTESINWLKAHDINLEQWQSTMTINAVTISSPYNEIDSEDSIEDPEEAVADFSGNTDPADTVSEDETADKEILLTDQSKIKELLPHLRLDNFVEHDYVLETLTEQNYYIYIYFEEATTGNIDVYTYYPEPGFDMETFLSSLD